ncbi:MD-2-related lipid-recognition protein-like [Daktulosphaira vitifoliae]|uniref:MD-2-related lipid-recognition protein-like n=1 Tax=Daktulosphaira vitifoliae TaxID=58002 RepID=UPI0021AA84E2|nr:MD-2-related lipid-recognition protein-like [Daktulosphaira vitifoliae]
MKYLTIFLFGFLFYNYINTEEVKKFRHCLNSNCVVTNVHIEPCPEALDDNPCEISLGNNATITFNYQPHFKTQAPKSRLYGVKVIDFPFLDMDSNGCLYTSCPLEVNVTKQYKFEFHASEIFPRGDHLTKMRIWDDSEKAKFEDQCCILFDVKLI